MKCQNQGVKSVKGVGNALERRSNFAYKKNILVAKVRWVVESANGRIKKWKALSNSMLISQIPYVRDYERIVCALCNAYIQIKSLPDV